MARMFALWGGESRAEFVDLFHPDCEVWPMTGDGPYRGREGVREFLEELDDNGQVILTEPPELLARGDTVLALAHLAVLEDGAPSAGALVAWVIDVSDGMVCRTRPFTDAHSARRTFAAATAA